MNKTIEQIKSEIEKKINHNKQCQFSVLTNLFDEKEPVRKHFQTLIDASRYCYYMSENTNSCGSEVQKRFPDSEWEYVTALRIPVVDKKEIDALKEKKTKQDAWAKKQLLKYVFDSVAYCLKGKTPDNELSKDLNDNFNNIAREIEKHEMRETLYKERKDFKNLNRITLNDCDTYKKMQEEINNLIENYEKPEGD